MHTCCAPCFSYIENDIKENGILNNSGKLEKMDYTAIWYNPNIHPKVEYEKRKDTFTKFCKMKGVNYELIDEYDLTGYVKNVVENVGENKKYSLRCEYCYFLRLEPVFKYAKEKGYDAVSTTLSISPYQNHELIKRAGQVLSNKYNTEFIYVDYMEHFREGQKMARDYGLYMQKYCGCIFSIDNGKWVY